MVSKGMINDKIEDLKNAIGDLINLDPSNEAVDCFEALGKVTRIISRFVGDYEDMEKDVVKKSITIRKLNKRIEKLNSKIRKLKNLEEK